MKVRTTENIDIEKDYNVSIKLSDEQVINCKYQLIRVEKGDGGLYTISGRFTSLSNIDKMTLVQFCMKKDMENLKENAKIWQETGSVHVAQLIYKNKSIIREDVSRHVAVDKVIGAAFKSGYDLTQSYITYSGRMPADMLIKVIRVGIPIIISNATPAASGYEIAKKRQYNNGWFC